MSEQLTKLPDRDIYEQLATEEAKTPDDIVTLREMAQADLGKVSIKPEGGKPIDVREIGSEKFAELSRVDQVALRDAMAVDSETWTTEDK